MPGWATIALLVALAVWTVVVSLRIESRVLRWWVTRTAGSIMRTACVTVLLHVALTVWCLMLLWASSAWAWPLEPGTWGAGLLTVGLAATVTPLVFIFVWTGYRLAPAYEDLSAAGATAPAARTIRWTSAPFAIVELVTLVAVVVPALLPL